MSASNSIPSKDITQGDYIAAGGMGKVYKAQWKGHEVAVKQLLVSTLSPEAQAELEKEAAIMARLPHPNIVTFYGVCTDTAPFQIVMEFMPNGSLFDLLQTKQVFSWQDRFRIALDTTRGVEHLHNNGIIHRDLKSLNILIDRSLKAKLTDFGLAKVKQEASTASKQSPAGTLQWMAPELFEDEVVYSPASDMFGLGVVFWELSSGKIPWSNVGNVQKIPLMTLQGKREAIPIETPDKFRELINGCWEQDPATRSSADKVIVDLSTLVQSDGKAEVEESGAAAAEATVVMDRAKVSGEVDYQAGVELLMKNQHRQALPYFEQAAAAEYPPAYIRLHLLFATFEGLVGPKDAQQAALWSTKAAAQIEWFKREAKTGTPAAQFDLGCCHFHGHGVPKDLAEAVQWWRLAANQENTWAQSSLGICYLSGLGVTKNPQAALPWLQLAAGKQAPEAQHCIGDCYFNGFGVTQSHKEAYQWFYRAAKQEYPPAQNRVGLCIEHGHGVAKDSALAAQWFSAAAERGCADAQVNLGYHYYEGRGVQRDYGRAAQWFRLSADQGLDGGQFNLAMCYYHGRGVTRDLRESARLMRLSAQQGSSKAQENLANLLRQHPHLQ